MQVRKQSYVEEITTKKGNQNLENLQELSDAYFPMSIVKLKQKIYVVEIIVNPFRNKRVLSVSNVNKQKDIKAKSNLSKNRQSNHNGNKNLENLQE